MNPLALKKELAELLEIPESQLDAALELQPLDNWDSLTKVTLLGVLNDQFGVALDPEALDEMQTLGDVFKAAGCESALV
ncbi:hypothetical protein NS274_12825 [Pseudomonas oryzihabitans]|nr:hypothetical protein NS274_12825 [Pseudomonas psychrotolerans]